MPVSPLCEVKDGSGSYQSTASGVEVAPGDTITIRLIDSSANSWAISCIGTADGADAATVTTALTIDPVLRTATFTAPAAGQTYIFRSVVNSGVGPDGRAVSSYSTQFGVYTLTTSAVTRVIAVGETTEGGPFGWTKPVNEVLRSGGVPAAVANDIFKSDGSTINRVRGHNGVPFKAADGSAVADGVAPPIGGAWVADGVGGSLSLKPVKPVMPGHFDVQRSYGGVPGAIPDWGGTRTATTTSGTPTVTVNTATGLFVGQKVAITGVTGTKTVTAISGTTITLNSNCDASVSGHSIYTDNFDAFNAVLAAMALAGTGNVVQKLVVDGWFYLGQTIVITQTIHLEGSGCSWALTQAAELGTVSSPGTWLVYPKNTSGIRCVSPLATDYFGPQTKGAFRTIIRDLTVSCQDGTTTSGNGIESSTTVWLENVQSEYFGGHGFFLRAHAYPTEEGSCDESRLYNCLSGANKGDGFHLEGEECNAITVDSCSALANTGRGYYDETGSGGTAYIGCHSEGNTGPQYETAVGGNGCSFLHCYHEGTLSKLAGENVVIGGNLAEYSATTTDSSCFNLFNGTATRVPFIYSNQRGANQIDAQLGESVSTSSMCVLQWEASFASSPGTTQDFSRLVYLGDSDPWMCLQNYNAFREVLRLPTIYGGPRSPAAWSPNGFFFGSRYAAPTLFMAAPSPPTHREEDAAYPQTNEVGDFVLNNSPVQNAPIGFRCLQAGTVDGASYVSATGAVTSGTTLVTLSGTGLNGLQLGQRVAIAGVTGTKKIVALNGVAHGLVGVPATTITLDSNADATVSGAAITFVAPTFESVGTDHTADILTTSATPALARRNPIADGHVLSNRWIVQVRSTDNSGAVLGEWEVKACHKRVSGTASAAYAATITNNFIVGSPGAPTVALNGSTDVDLFVTGIAATNLTWSISEFSL